MLTLQSRLVSALTSEGQSADQLAAALAAADEVETIHLLLEHLAANGRANRVSGDGPESLYTKS